jgi:pimeloyl-ACP methyl ester carboxylesterase
MTSSWCVADLLTLEQRMDDVRAVMDAAGSERAAVFGISEGGPMCLTFAATYPERTSALLVYGSFARLARALDYPIGAPESATERFLEGRRNRLGHGCDQRGALCVQPGLGREFSPIVGAVRAVRREPLRDPSFDPHGGRH